MLKFDTLPPTPDSVSFTPGIAEQLRGIGVQEREVSMHIGVEAEMLRNVGKHVGMLLAANEGFPDGADWRAVNAYTEALTEGWHEASQAHFSVLMNIGANEEINAAAEAQKVAGA